jgi:hypothetical protein
VCVLSPCANKYIYACSTAPPLYNSQMNGKRKVLRLHSALFIIVHRAAQQQYNHKYVFVLIAGWECLFTCSAQLSACALKPAAHTYYISCWAIMEYNARRAPGHTSNSRRCPHVCARAINCEARALLILLDANIYGRDSNQMNVNQLINSARESIPLLGIMASVGQLCDARLIVSE